MNGARAKPAYLFQESTWTHGHMHVSISFFPLSLPPGLPSLSETWSLKNKSIHSTFKFMKGNSFRPSHCLNSDHFLVPGTIFEEINITQDITVVLHPFFLSEVCIREKNRISS